jgi:peptide-methionine (S)-S-oxide reductase
MVMCFDYFFSLSRAFVSICRMSVLACGLITSLVPDAAGQDIRSETDANKPTENRQFAVFGGGCFWCIEAVFERVLGVYSVESGYAGGNIPNPTYEMVSTDQTGHAEVCRIEFDPEVISYEELLRIFFKSHDPTLLNAQGPDYGTRYRSVILYANDEQQATIDRVMEEFRKKRTFRKKIVTQVAPINTFYLAEEYHQDYFAKHPEKPYCEINIRPKIGKFERAFKEFSKVQNAKNEREKDDK